MRHDNRSNIVPLDELDDFEVADHDPDVRGWKVFADDGRRIGEVEELLVDPAAMKVRYLEVDLDDEWRGSDRERHILIPIGHARLDDDDDRVLLSNIRAEQVRSIPEYTGRVDRQYEDSLRSHFGTAGARTGDVDYYGGEHFDDSRFYGARRARDADAAGGLGAGGTGRSGSVERGRSSTGAIGDEPGRTDRLGDRNVGDDPRGL